MTEYIDRTQEPDDVFEREVLAKFDAAPTPPEVLREQVAREMWAADAAVDVDQLPGETPEPFYRLADVALAVFRGQQDPAVQFAEWVVSLDDDDPESPGRQERRTVTLTQIIGRARAAIGGAA